MVQSSADDNDSCFSNDTTNVDSGSEDGEAYETDLTDNNIDAEETIHDGEESNLIQLLADNEHPPEYFSSCICPNTPRPRLRSSLQYSFRVIRLFLPYGSIKVWTVEPSRNSVSSLESCTRSSGGGMTKNFRNILGPGPESSG